MPREIMDKQTNRPARWIGVAGVALLGILLATPASALTRGWYTGLGLVNESMGGEINGTGSRTGSGYTLDLGRPESGGGYAFKMGYNLDYYFGFDLSVVSSTHKALHTTAGPQTAILRGNTVSARVATGGRRIDLFARLGWGATSIEYDKAATTTQPNQPALLKGRGGSYGVGLEHLYQAWGVELAYDVKRVRFDHLNAGAVADNLTPGINTSVRTFLFSVNYYFR